jgi:hypothetical protein
MEDPHMPLPTYSEAQEMLRLMDDIRRDESSKWRPLAYELLSALRKAREYVAATEGSLPISPNVLTPDRQAADLAIAHAEAILGYVDAIQDSGAPK